MVTPVAIGIVVNGLPTDQSTCGVAIMGAMLKFPMEVNCTCRVVFCAVAEAGVTVMLWSCRVVEGIIMLPPQAAMASATGRTNNEARKDFISASQEFQRTPCNERGSLRVGQLFPARSPGKIQSFVWSDAPRAANHPNLIIVVLSTDQHKLQLANIPIHPSGIKCSLE
jgi:hypothetical protein